MAFSLISISVGIILASFIPTNIPIIVIEGSLGNPAILSSVGARLLLNMKEAGAKGVNEGMGGQASSATVSRMDFVDTPVQDSIISITENAEGDDSVEIESIGA